MSAETSRPLRRDPWSPGWLVLALLLITLWPGDVSWLLDEPRLIATAWHANHDHQIAVGGLYGNFGIRYGPLPTQIYQLLLLITHDPFALVVLRALLCAGVTGGALLWLARSLDLPGWLVAGVLASPHVVAYQRVLWDASFAMPVGALALAGFADFLCTRRAWSLRLCVIASVLVLTIHPQSLPLAGALLGWLGWNYRAALWRDRRALCVAGAVVLLLNGFYFVQFAGQLCARLGGSMQKGYPNGASHLASALAPLLGGRLLSGADYLSTLARLSAPVWLHVFAEVCAMLVYPLAWIGIGVAACRTWRANATTPRQGVTLVLLVALGLQALLFGAMRIPAAPQYFFGTFPLHVLAVLLAVDAMQKWRLGTILGGLYAVGSAILTLEAAISIHHHGFERPLWPTLSDSVSVAVNLNRYSNTTALTDVAVYQKSPQALRTLRLLLPPSANPPPNESGHLRITDNPAIAGQLRHPVVIELAPGTPPPPGDHRIDITPLSKDWVPDPSTW